VSRTSVLIHLLDASRVSEEEPLADWRAINAELELFDPALAAKPQIVVANKVDVTEGRANAGLLQQQFSSKGIPFCAISAVTGEGLLELKRLIGVKVKEAKTDKGEDRVAAGV
jgi:GTP-binding protein